METDDGQALDEFWELLSPELRAKLNELAREAKEHGYAVLKIIVIGGKGESLRIEKMVR